MTWLRYMEQQDSLETSDNHNNSVENLKQQQQQQDNHNKKNTITMMIQQKRQQQLIGGMHGFLPNNLKNSIVTNKLGKRLSKLVKH